MIPDRPTGLLDVVVGAAMLVLHLLVIPLGGDPDDPTIPRRDT